MCLTIMLNKVLISNEALPGGGCGGVGVHAPLFPKNKRPCSLKMIFKISIFPVPPN